MISEFFLELRLKTILHSISNSKLWGSGYCSSGSLLLHPDKSVLALSQFYDLRKVPAVHLHHRPKMKTQGRGHLVTTRKGTLISKIQ